MIPKVNETRYPDYREVHGDTAMYPAESPTLVNSTGAAVKAERCALSVLGRSDGAYFVCIALYLNEVGIHQAFTPEGAREMAAMLLKGADRAEADMAQAANAQLDAALRKGKPE